MYQPSHPSRELLRILGFICYVPWLLFMLSITENVFKSWDMSVDTVDTSSALRTLVI